MEQKLHDIYDVWHVPFWQQRWFYWTVWAVCIALFLILLCIAIKKYYARKKNSAKKPWDTAFESLSLLQEKKVTTIEEGGNLYVSLTHILKKYLHQRYGFDIASKTDDEVITYLEEQRFEPSLLADIREIFEGSVYIKFAHVHVMQEHIEKDLARSIAFIKATLPTHTNK
jgi:hypothetical protein